MSRYIYSDAIYNILSHVFLWHVCVDVCISLVHIRAPHMAYRIKMSSSAVHVNQGPVSCCNDETKNRCTSHPHGGLFMDFNQPDLGIQPTNINGDTYILCIYTYLYIYIQHMYKFYSFMLFIYLFIIYTHVTCSGWDKQSTMWHLGVSENGKYISFLGQ